LRKNNLLKFGTVCGHVYNFIVCRNRSGSYHFAEDALLIVANPLQYKNTTAGFDALVQAKKKRMNNSS